MSSGTASTRKVERRRQIFLIARAIFTGDKAQIRDKISVRSIVSEHDQTFSAVNQIFGRNIVIEVIFSLLNHQVFESELKAKEVFPELYQISAVRDLQHVVSENEAARSEAKALQDVSKPDKDNSRSTRTNTTHSDGSTASNGGIAKLRSGKEVIALKGPSSPATTIPPSLFPCYLSYSVQHVMLNTLQRLLEHCCFDFATRWLPDVLRAKNWECAEAVELNQWDVILPQRFDEIGAEATNLDSAESLTVALRATHPLRHAAVHRLATSVKGIEEMLESASQLAKALRDTPRVLKLETLLLDFKGKVKDMELYKNHLENQLDEKLRGIETRRSALDAQEAAAKAIMSRRDRENTERISSLIGNSITGLQSDKRKPMPEQHDRDAPVSHDRMPKNVVSDVSSTASSTSRELVGSIDTLPANNGQVNDRDVSISRDRMPKNVVSNISSATSSTSGELVGSSDTLPANNGQFNDRDVSVFYDSIPQEVPQDDSPGMSSASRELVDSIDTLTANNGHGNNRDVSVSHDSTPGEVAQDDSPGLSSASGELVGSIDTLPANNRQINDRYMSVSHDSIPQEVALDDSPSIRSTPSELLPSTDPLPPNNIQLNDQDMDASTTSLNGANDLSSSPSPSELTEVPETTENIPVMHAIYRRLTSFSRRDQQK